MFALLLPILLPLLALAFLGLMYAVVVSVAKADRAQAATTRINAEYNRQDAARARAIAYGATPAPRLR